MLNPLKITDRNITGKWWQLLLTDGHEDLIDIHGGLGGCLHEKQAVVVCVCLRFLGRRAQKIRKKHEMITTTINIIIKATFVCAHDICMCAYLEIHSSLISKVGFVSRQGDDYVGAGLSLELLYPVLCSGESVLEFNRNCYGKVLHMLEYLFMHKKAYREI